MEIVASSSDDERARRRALDDAGSALATLAANLMRISRGAGKPADVAVQAAEVVIIVREYEALTGHGVPVGAVSDALSVRPAYEWTMQFPDDERERIRATEQMIAGALQVAASRLVGQKTQERAGDDELYRGVSRLRELQEELRRQRQAATRAAKPKADKVSRRIQKK
jgi:hypothetical protein